MLSLDLMSSGCHNMVGIGGGVFSILTGVGLLIDLLLLLDGAGILEVNFAEIFCLSEFKFLLTMSKSYLD